MTTYNDDAVNRITSKTYSDDMSGRTHPLQLLWTESYGYDRYGNRWLSGTSGLPV